MRSGWSNVGIGALKDTGINGIVWSSLSHANIAYPYNLYFNSTKVLPSDGNDRHLAFTVQMVDFSKKDNNLLYKLANHFDIEYRSAGL